MGGGWIGVRTEVAWDHHELVASIGSMGFEPSARLVLETEISPA